MDLLKMGPGDSEARALVVGWLREVQGLFAGRSSVFEIFLEL